MTIKELEQRTGMTRANIRYYEQEGLLNPERTENGYRNYTEEDYTALMRIKLLRQLQFSVFDIKSLSKGTYSLPHAMLQRSQALLADRNKLEIAQEICQKISKEVPSYSQLQPQDYLPLLDRPGNTQPVPKEDAIEPHPVRRYFARAFDLSFAALIVAFFQYFLFKMSPSNSAGSPLISTLLAWGVLLLIEPFCLHFFGTTPGKWIWGIRVDSIYGDKLTLYEAFARTGRVFFYGEGCCVPLLSLFCNFRSYQKCSDGEELSWEEDSITYYTERKWVSPTLHAVLAVVMVFLVFLCVVSAYLPPNTGDLTVAEFSENFNHYCDFFGYDGYRRLDEQGNWQEHNELVYWNINVPTVDFVFQMDGDTITEVSFEMEFTQESDFVHYNNQWQAEMAYCAFATGSGRANCFNILSLMSVTDQWYPTLSFQGQWHNINVIYTYDIAYADLNDTSAGTINETFCVELTG